MVSSATPIDTAASTRGLRAWRNLMVLVALACGAALPFQVGILDPTRIPVVGKEFAPPAPPALAVVSVQNEPKTAIIGQTERFSVRLSGMAHARLTYVLRYPDNSQQTASVWADGQGYSSHVFHLTGFTLTHFREENASISVQTASGATVAAQFFAIQQK